MDLLLLILFIKRRIFNTRNTSAVAPGKDNMVADVLFLVFEYLSESEIELNIFCSIDKTVYQNHINRAKNNPTEYPIRNYLNTTNAVSRQMEIDRITKSHSQLFISALGGYQKIVFIPEITIGSFVDFSCDIKVPVARGFDKLGQAFYLAQAYDRNKRLISFRLYQPCIELSDHWLEFCTNGGATYTTSTLESNINTNIKYSGHHILFTLRCQSPAPEPRTLLDKVLLKETSYAPPTRHLSFFAQLVKTGEVGFPTVGIGFGGNTQEPNPGDVDYSPIRLVSN
ncbi:MAG: quinolinate synthase NadA [Legionella sp.]|nr:quinolinate synthase NadA [Legionella sp.]